MDNEIPKFASDASRCVTFYLSEATKIATENGYDPTPSKTIIFIAIAIAIEAGCQQISDTIQAAHEKD